jgi:hypothetical protein
MQIQKPRNEQAIVIDGWIQDVGGMRSPGLHPHCTRDVLSMLRMEVFLRTCLLIDWAARLAREIESKKLVMEHRRKRIRM